MSSVTIDMLITNLQSVKMKEVISSSIDATRYDLVAAQQDQMIHGINSKGAKIGKYRSEAYAKKKYAQSRKAGYGYKDEFLTGDFQHGIFIDARDSSVVFASDDPKTAQIVERDGEKIFGLSERYAEQYSTKKLTPEAVRRIKKQIFK